MKKQLKKWIDANVHDGQDRSGCNKDRITFTPDQLQELIEEAFDDIVQPRIDNQRRIVERMKHDKDMFKIYLNRLLE